MGISPRDLLRTTEPEYAALGLSDRSLSDDELLDAMADNPGLIQRPIIEFGGTAVLARPAVKVDEIIAALKAS
jgi:arsenate reductase